MVTIKVVGSGCPTCQKLGNLCRQVIDEKNMNAQVEKVTDVNKFAELGIFLTPGLIINDKIVSRGKVPTKETLRNWIKKAQS